MDPPVEMVAPMTLSPAFVAGAALSFCGRNEAGAVALGLAQWQNLSDSAAPLRLVGIDGPSAFCYRGRLFQQTT